MCYTIFNEVKGVRHKFQRCMKEIIVHEHAKLNEIGITIFKVKTVNILKNHLKLQYKRKKCDDEPKGFRFKIEN